PFTGDYAGILLYKTLFEFGFSNIPESISADDGLILSNCRITNAVKCLPPDNKPTTKEIVNCNGYLQQELQVESSPDVILALGKIAHDSVLRAYSLKLNHYKFSHNAKHAIKDDIILLDSYHCSRYNTQTKRLTEEMFKDVIKHAKELIDEQAGT
ncbi:MAG: uracil-DNA glycosylase, partial [Gammaproteobacteria bacterium]|nr:uracil-DNA glycosylase [Gammaproteobacteria bacterium]